jgi:hypothetical protein
VLGILNIFLDPQISNAEFQAQGGKSVTDTAGSVFYLDIFVASKYFKIWNFFLKLIVRFLQHQEGFWWPSN